MNHLHIVKKSSERWYAEAASGSHILAVCRAAAQMVAELQVEVAFDFNGITLVAIKGGSAEQLAAQFTADSNRRARDWQASAEGQQQAAKQQQERTQLQFKVDELLAVFDTVVGVQSTLVDWLGQFSELNDYMGLVFDKSALVAKLEAAGYAENAEVGKGSPKEFLTDKAKMARYIVGQAINNLRSGMPVHPICSRFAAEYAA
jgi:hypothetical protein